MQVSNLRLLTTHTGQGLHTCTCTDLQRLNLTHFQVDKIYMQVGVSQLHFGPLKILLHLAYIYITLASPFGHQT